MSEEKKPSLDSVHEEFSNVRSQLSAGWSERTGGRVRQPKMRKVRVSKSRAAPSRSRRTEAKPVPLRDKIATKTLDTIGSAAKSIFNSARNSTEDDLNAFYFGDKRRRKS